MKKNLLALLACVCVFSSCVINLGPYPSEYYSYEWTEISLDEAREIWKAYDTSSMLHSNATVYKDYPGKGYIVYDCPVSRGDGVVEKGYILEVMAEIVNLNVDFSYMDEYDESGKPLFVVPKFFVCKENQSLVKIDGIGSWWDSCIYSNGWLVECRKDQDNGYSKDHEYYLIKYKD